MKIYVVQKAIDAFEELTKIGTIEERLAGAWAHLGGHGNDFWLEDAQDVKEAYKDAIDAQSAGNLDDEVSAIRSIITRIFIESGYAKAASELSAN